MFHPHHLLFTPLVHLFGLALAALSGNLDPIMAGQIHNLLWAGVALLCTFLSAREVLGSDAGAILTALGLLVCRGFWLYTTQLEVYVPAMGCLALLTVVLIRRRNRRLDLRHHLLLAALLALAVFYHQANLIFCLPLVYLLLAGGRNDRRGALVALGCAGSIVLIGYLAAFGLSDARESPAASLAVQAETGLRGFVRFCLAYAFHPSPGWGTWRNLGPFGAGRLIHSQLRDVTTFPWELRYVVIPGFAVSLAALCGWHLKRFLAGRMEDVTRGFLLLWLATFYAFYLWWFPGEKEFFIIPLFPLALLVAMAGKDLLERRRDGRYGRGLGLIVAVLGIGLIGSNNLRSTILPYHDSRGPAYHDAELLASGTPADCLAVVDYAVGQNLRYYFGRERFIEAQMALFYFYEDRDLPKEYRLESSRCIVADLALVSPAYSLGGLNARDQPSEWLRYFRWVFGVESDPEGRPARCRSFEIVGLPDTSLYARLGPSTQAIDGLGPLFGRLDDEWEARAGPGGRPFSAWLPR